MRAKTIFASFVTLTFLCGFVFASLVGLALASREVDLVPALALGVGATALWSFLVWLISPFVMDLIQRWVYAARPMSLEDLARERPAVAAFVQQVCERHRIKTPRLKVIDDMAPQAYCYGSYANNARLVTTRGLWHYLDDEELKAVYGHELGHIVHRDFIVMTIAATLLSILWNIYVIARNIRGKNNSRPAYPIALVALAFWWVSQYMLLYLSRTREYYADAFAAAETGNPNALSMALIKIAYGLTKVEPTPLAQKLLGGTRAMGISDSRSSSGAGYAYGAINEKAQQGAPMQPAYAGAVAIAAPAIPSYGVPGAAAPAAGVAVTMDGVRRIEKVMLFDLYNPWGTVSELGSTHPLTGKRIRALGEQSQSMGRPPLLSFERVDASGQALDMSRMYGTFLFEVVIYFLPHILGAMSGLLALGCLLTDRPVLAGAFGGGILAAIGLGMTIKGFYRFPSLGSPPALGVIDLMSDPYASPLKGRPVVLEGTVIGRASAGNRLSEDVMIEDRGGGLMMINYESPFGGLGNWWFAMRRVGRLMTQEVQVTGWFRRGVSQQVDLKSLRTRGGEKVSSWTAFWGKCGGILVLLIGLVVGAAGAFAALPENGGLTVPRTTAAGAANVPPTATATAATAVAPTKPSAPRVPAALPPAVTTKAPAKHP
jgi:Zn-dependent protease with chaperone function